MSQLTYPRADLVLIIEFLWKRRIFPSIGALTAIIQKYIVDKLVEDMLNQEIIQHSNSPYASPVVLIKKKYGSWRLCVDYRMLNQQTVKDMFLIQLIEDLMDELGGSAVYFKLDLSSGYHQVRLVEGEEYKTTFKTHARHFEYLVMPFGSPMLQLLSRH